VSSDLLSKEELPPDVSIGLVADLLQKKRWLMATAESCTGGMISAACTDLAGSSAWFERGFVTYSNEAKTELLGVDASLIKQHGAVSEEVARAMASRRCDPLACASRRRRHRRGRPDRR
jgi:nicotinamide-nucleotide amidase